MSKETFKSNKRRKGTWLFNKVFSGVGLDICPGRSPLREEDFPNIRSMSYFTWEQGDANNIEDFVKPESFDFVYSSNCLEHMTDAKHSFKQWWRLVKPGGYLVITVPDEDLYEQGEFGRFNRNHKHSFTIYKERSWCDKSINVLDIIKLLDDYEIIRIELVDTNYDYSIPRGQEDQTYGHAEAFIEFILRKLGNE